MKLKPTGNNLIIETIEAPDKSPGGILLPDNAKGRSGRGKIVAAGPGKRVTWGTGEININWPSAPGGKVQANYLSHGMKSGDVVCYREYSGTEVESEGKKYLILDAENVIAIEA